MPDASLYASVAYVVTALALIGYAAYLWRRSRRVVRLFRDRSEARGAKTDAPGRPVDAEAEDWLIRISRPPAREPEARADGSRHPRGETDGHGPGRAENRARDGSPTVPDSPRDAREVRRV